MVPWVDFQLEAVSGISLENLFTFGEVGNRCDVIGRNVEGDCDGDGEFQGAVRVNPERLRHVIVVEEGACNLGTVGNSDYLSVIFFFRVDDGWKRPDPFVVLCFVHLVQATVEVWPLIYVILGTL